MQKYGVSPRWNWGLDDYNNNAYDNVRVNIRDLAAGRGSWFRVGHAPEAQSRIASSREPDQGDWDLFHTAPRRASTPGVPGFGVLQPMRNRLMVDTSNEVARNERLSDEILRTRASARRFVASSPITDNINNLVSNIVTNSVAHRATNRERTRAVFEAEGELRRHQESGRRFGPWTRSIGTQTESQAESSAFGMLAFRIN